MFHFLRCDRTRRTTKESACVFERRCRLRRKRRSKHSSSKTNVPTLDNGTTSLWKRESLGFGKTWKQQVLDRWSQHEFTLVICCFFQVLRGSASASVKDDAKLEKKEKKEQEQIQSATHTARWNFVSWRDVFIVWLFSFNGFTSVSFYCCHPSKQGAWVSEESNRQRSEEEPGWCAQGLDGLQWAFCIYGRQKVCPDLKTRRCLFRVLATCDLHVRASVWRHAAFLRVRAWGFPDNWISSMCFAHMNTSATLACKEMSWWNHWGFHNMVCDWDHGQIQTVVQQNHSTSDICKWTDVCVVWLGLMHVLKRAQHDWMCSFDFLKYTSMMDDILFAMLFWLAPMIFGSFLTLVLQFCWRSIGRRPTRELAKSTSDVKKKPKKDDDAASHIFLSSTGKEHKIASCCGKHPQKIAVCGKCFKWNIGIVLHSRRQEWSRFVRHCVGKKGFGLEVRFTRSILVHQSQISYVQLSFCVLIYHWGERHVLADIRFTDLNCQFSISWLVLLYLVK